ncbi:hypothetical protein CGRA01v4_13067 [Colletotrichum graminicola]|uniref:Uncharacterized protein n=1 Tax=Colletotrichum graminicola (strain M1.001 / M2 / FGSC 10212) TaxID=645133 RepID=E3QM12_COLGM|nr:uncharacterized protein GLRG_07044 [Colletotrichum graminicola M1.001]EFQ31900.1 hypothetical protein GLRG_07044 [Colletotrichum graminicola M1.001]WDK21777.1 hypothetical protein CGRA01v4_13067 [Colletotrichum graminicola]
MAVTVEERFRQMQATRMPAFASSYPAAWSVTTAAKRRAASSATITTLAKRRKDSTPPRKSRSTSTPSTRGRKASTPSSVATLALPVERTLGAPYTVVPTLPRTYLNFSHFFRTMGFEIRDKSLRAIENAGVYGEERWRAHHYDPLYATESCKLAFLIQVEALCGREESEGQEHACYRCYTLKPKGAFEDKPHHIIVSPHGRLTKHAYTDKDLPVIRRGESLLRRFCIECGVRDGIYPSTELVFSMTGDKWWVCECRHLHWISPPESYVECRRCLAKSGFRQMALEDGTSVSPGGFSP